MDTGTMSVGIIELAIVGGLVLLGIIIVAAVVMLSRGKKG